jgi:hypothetical protein
MAMAVFSFSPWTASTIRAPAASWMAIGSSNRWLVM